MAVSTTTQTNAPLVTSIVTDTDSDLTVRQAAGAESRLYFVEITNPNVSGAVYVKLFAAALSGSITTQTQHFMQFYCPSNTTCYTYIPAGAVIPNGICYYTSNESGKAGSLTAPSNNVTVKIGSTPT